MVENFSMESCCLIVQHKVGGKGCGGCDRLERVLECSSFGELTPGGLEVGVGPTKRLWSFSGAVFTTTWCCALIVPPLVVAAFAESVRFAIKLFRFGGGGDPFSWSGTIGIEAFVTGGGSRFCNVAGVRRLAVR